MKVSYLSDLHLDSNHSMFDLNLLDKGDVLVLAGDIFEIHNYENIKMFLGRFFEKALTSYSHVLYVPGNHEFYGGKINDGVKMMKRYIPSSVKILNDEYIDIQNVRFVGSTLWTDFGNSVQNELAAQVGMADYRHIKESNGQNLVTHTIKKINANSAHFIFKTVEDTDKKCVVISHHAPSFKSSDPRYPIDKLSSAFYNSYDFPIGIHHNLTHWIHGHIHCESDYMIDHCRVLCNPFGYRRYGENKTIEYSLKTFVIES